MLLDNCRTTPDLDRKGRTLIHLNTGKTVCWVMLSSLIFSLSLRTLLELYISQKKKKSSYHVEDGDRNVRGIHRGSVTLQVYCGAAPFLGLSNFPHLQMIGQGSQLCPAHCHWYGFVVLQRGCWGPLESLNELGWSRWCLLSRIICEAYRPAIAVSASSKRAMRQYAIIISLSSTGSTLLPYQSCPFVHYTYSENTEYLQN